MNVLDLFSGIGGISLGLERAGMRTIAFCEIDPFCRAVLAKHWPNVPLYEDVRTLTADGLGRVDLVAGGFPCQDISVAGKGAGIDGVRSGLWSEMFRLVRELRPAWIFAENVPALRTRGADRVLSDLQEAGYAAWPFVVGADDVGFAHRRKRVWIVAHAISDGLQERSDVAGAGANQAGTEHARCTPHGVPAPEDAADSERGQRSLGREAGRIRRLDEPISRPRNRPLTSEPVLDRGADGVPNRIHRLRALGNSVVPQIPEIIGRAIMRCAK